MRNGHKNTLGDVDYDALVDIFSNSLAYMETDTHCDTLGQVRRKSTNKHTGRCARTGDA